MISLKKQFLFIHYPKTGGTSFQNILVPYTEYQINRQNPNNTDSCYLVIDPKNSEYGKHWKLGQYKEALDKDTYQKLFKFAVIRNPWDLMISWYFSPHSHRKQWNRDKFIQLVNSVSRLRDYIQTFSTIERVGQKLLRTYPVMNYLIEDKPLDSEIDYLIKFETINEDFKQVCRLLDIPEKNLPHKHKSNRHHYSYYYDQELQEIVAMKFKKEIDFIGYEFEKSDTNLTP
jgi:hypothetical protein